MIHSLLAVAHHSGWLSRRQLLVARFLLDVGRALRKL